jgi:TolB-like protein/Tfp pilus assembly protein PilF
MASASHYLQTVRFGIFEVDLRARELRRRGLRLRLQEKPFQILEMLLERTGEVVARADLRKRLWPDTYVGFDRSLNTAVNILRRVLGDSAENPRFVETCQRRGYRFIAPVERLGSLQLTPAEAIDSIAVLPLWNESGDAEMDYLCDGITECLINTLSRLPGVRVMARATVFRYKGQRIDPQTVGHALNVRAVVMGRVLKHRDSLGISIEAVDARSGWQLWGETFNRKPADLFVLQEEIARDICDRLRPQLPSDERSSLIGRYTQDAEAYRDYLKGRYCLNKLTEDSLQRGVAQFKEAVRKDPQYAPAWAELAACYGLFAFFGLLPPRKAMPEARDAAARALALDDGLPEAHTSMAGILKTYEWNWNAAEEEYRRALELNPNFATGHHLYADFLSALGRSREAIGEIRKALELDPLSLVIQNEVSWNLFMARQYEEALDFSLRALEMEPAFPATHHTLGLIYEQLGRFDEAVAELEEARAHSRGNPAALAALGHACALAGRRADSARILDEMRALSACGYVPACQQAILSAGMGDRDAAFEWLQRAVDERDVWLVWVKREPRLDTLRSDARFDRILRTVGLAP